MLVIFQRVHVIQFKMTLNKSVTIIMFKMSNGSGGMSFAGFSTVGGIALFRYKNRFGTQLSLACLSWLTYVGSLFRCYKTDSIMFPPPHKMYILI